MIAGVEERLERQAQNEAMMRTVNEKIADLDRGAAAWADADQTFDFVCECGRISGCDSRVPMTLAQYGRVRAQRDRFAVVPGHQTDDIEYVVEANELYCIVDKRDEVEHLVE
jgi:hypothetical protein